MRALFGRGAFTAADAAAAGATLRAYALGLIPFVLIRSLVATFFARGDTATPVKASLTAAAINVALKVALVTGTSLAQVGLALATSAGAWINVALVTWFATRAGLFALDARLSAALAKLAAGAVLLAVVLWSAQHILLGLTADWTHGRDPAVLAAMVALGCIAYIPAVIAVFGRNWRAWLGAGRQAA
jgi:putative peptidoglycan lipid II flippase